MGSDASVYIVNKTREDVFNFIKMFVDSEAKFKTISTHIEIDMQTIGFYYISKDRNMRCYNHEVSKDKYDNDYENNPQTVDSYSLIHDGLPDGIKGVWCILGANENATNFFTFMVSYFGGWMQENDSKDKFEYIKPRPRYCIAKYFRLNSY